MEMLIKSHQEFKFLKKIIKDVLGINVEKNKSRLREVVNAKMIYASILSEKGYGCSAIGKSLGMNHATILHYNRNIVFYLKTDSNLRYNYNLVESEYNSEFITTSELTIEEIKNELISLRVENKSLHSTISNLEEENKNLQKEKDIFGRQERMTEIFEVVRQRTKIGTEDKLLKKLNIFYNGLY
jgi:FtsZ-binding cell division protein ZapB